MASSWRPPKLKPSVPIEEYLARRRNVVRRAKNISRQKKASRPPPRYIDTPPPQPAPPKEHLTEAPTPKVLRQPQPPPEAQLQRLTPGLLTFCVERGNAARNAEQGAFDAWTRRVAREWHQLGDGKRALYEALETLREE